MHTPDTTALDAWLRYLIDSRATDLHFSAGSVPRIRVDGRLTAVGETEASTDESLLSIVGDILGPSATSALNDDRQVDFAFSWSYDPDSDAPQERFRGNAFFQSGRPALALRHIPGAIPTPDDIGLPESVASLLTRPHGLVLITGPTGSGKSTTQAAMLGWINTHRPLHILTIEDPIEYVHPSASSLVNQREVGSDVPTFTHGLEAALREDPDVVLVGEMRDLDTISLTLTLAETGHLVFATLHTNDAAQAVDRIIDSFPAAQQDQVRTQLSMTLAAVISQRLVRRTQGGRIAAYEVLMGTTAASNVIREGKIRQLRNLIATSQREGMRTLEHSLTELVKDGTISIEEARAVSLYPDEIAAGPTGTMATGVAGVAPAS